MRRALFNVPVFTAILWLAFGVWTYALVREPGTSFYGTKIFPTPKAETPAVCK
jgi:hypothetical protein